MPNKKARTAPQIPSGVHTYKRERLRVTTISFGNRSDDWLVLGDWLAAGEKLKTSPLRGKPA